MNLHTRKIILLKINFIQNENYLTLLIPDKELNSLQAAILKDILNKINIFLKFYNFKLVKDESTRETSDWIGYNIVLADDKITTTGTIVSLFDELKDKQ